MSLSLQQSSLPRPITGEVEEGLICFAIPFLQSRLELGREDNHSEYLARSLHETDRLAEHQICLL